MIPDRWEIKKLNNVITLLKDGTHGTHKNISDGIPLLSAKDIKDGGIELNNSPRQISQSEYETIHRNYSIKKDDILITIVGTIGRVAIVDLCSVKKPFSVQRSVAILRMDKSIIPIFAFHFFQSSFFLRELLLRANASAQAGVYLGELKKIKIFLPPLSEQKKIADILTSVDNAIQATQKVIDQTEKVKKGLLQELLMKGIGRSDLPEGQIPDGWKETFISDICDVKGGKRLPKGYKLQKEPTRNPYIRVSDMIQGSICLKNILYVPDAIADAISRYKISKDDLYISVAGTLGIVGNIPTILHNANLTENADKLTNIKCDKRYLFQYLISDNVQGIIQNEKTQNAQPKLAIDRIKLFQILLPPLPEQKKIADILSSVDESIKKARDKKSQLEQVKKGLMQDLLTGKVRVKV